MGLSKSHRRRVNLRHPFLETFYKRRLHLLRHSQQSRLRVSKSLATDILDEDIRRKQEVLDDLSPQIEYGNLTTLEPVEEAKILEKSISHNNIMNFIPNDEEEVLSSSTEYESPETETLYHYVHRQKKKRLKRARTGRSPYKYPALSELEEAGIREYYDTFLDTASWQVSNMILKPGDKHFLLWFFSSSYIPLICSCTGPLSNIFSLLAIICPWKLHKVVDIRTKDPFWCYLINSISIAFAVTSNFFLLLNYRRKLRYASCQVISISGWGIASLMLTGLIIGYHVWFYTVGLEEEYLLGEGFWYACITAILHFINFTLLAVNEIGFLKKKYKPVFNIDHVEETLVIQTTLMGVWLIIGAAVFTRVLNLRLSDAYLYFVTSVVTIGMQGVVPMNNVAGETLTSIWIICGLVMFGLIITSIGKMMFNFSKSTLYRHRIEHLRKKILKVHRMEEEIVTTNEDSFKLMGNIHKWALFVQAVMQLVISVAIFMITLLCGALAFSLLEQWSYKDSVYFCFYNLITLGQGSQSPSTPGGKTFFTAWALAAIPVMTILISTSSDFVFSKLTQIEKIPFFEIVFEYCNSHSSLRRFGEFLRTRELRGLERQKISDLASIALAIVKENSDDLSLKGTANPDPFKKVPILCHPADLLYSVLLNSENISSYDFIVSTPFVKLNAMTIQLANYFREGQSVNLDTVLLSEKRTLLTTSFQTLDGEFNSEKFKALYKIEDGGVVSPDGIIVTNFKKKNDFVLDKLSRLQVLFLNLRTKAHDMCTDPTRKYEFEEWEILLRLTNQTEALDDSFYWIESRSPLTFPINQPRYFMLHYIRHIVLFLQEFAAEWDNM